MSSAFQILRFELATSEVDSFVKSSNEIRKFLETQTGYRGGSSFIIKKARVRRTTENGLVLIEFDSVPNLQSANNAWLTSASMKAQSPDSRNFVPNITTLSIVEQHGLRPLEMASGSFISLSIRTADPGRELELINDFKIVFGEMTVIPGLRGWAIGAQSDLAERLFGIALWDDEESYLSTLPKSLPYNLEFLQKI